MKDYKRNSRVIERNIQERRAVVKKEYFRINQSKGIIDEIDRVLAGHFGFTTEELDFIINYDIKYRMGFGGDEVED